MKMAKRRWQVHLRTANPIESAFATIRHRTDRAKAAGAAARCCR